MIRRCVRLFHHIRFGDLAFDLVFEKAKTLCCGCFTFDFAISRSIWFEKARKSKMLHRMLRGYSKLMQQHKRDDFSQHHATRVANGWNI